jgi:uncharacterized alkaline shock family protein YloU
MPPQPAKRFCGIPSLPLIVLFYGKLLCISIAFPPLSDFFLGLVLYSRIVYNKTLKVRAIPEVCALPFPIHERKDILMIQFNSEQGAVSVSSAVFSNIAGIAATNCFGVKGMAYRSMTDGLVHLLRREAMSKGVSITYHDDNSISIELHIIVENGVNLPAVCRSIMNEVRYVVTRNTGVAVKAVDVCVDSMIL